jgi:hypothetical protein
MNRRLIWFLAGLALCGCQMGGGPVSDDCPSPNPCDDLGQQGRLPLSPSPLPTTPAAWRPLWPGCPSTLQVMARPSPIVFRTVRPEEAPETAPDPFDWVCEPPEAPLLRAGRQRPDQDAAVR